MEDLAAQVEMVGDVTGDQGQPLVRADDGLELRPPGVELFLAIELLALGGLLEIRVDLRFFFATSSSSFASRLS